MCLHPSSRILVPNTKCFEDRFSTHYVYKDGTIFIFIILDKDIGYVFFYLDMKQKMKENDAPSCPHCGSDETYYGEYGVGCDNDGLLSTDGCPVVFFREQ